MTFYPNIIFFKKIFVSKVGFDDWKIFRVLWWKVGKSQNPREEKDFRQKGNMVVLLRDFPMVNNYIILHFSKIKKWSYILSFSDSPATGCHYAFNHIFDRVRFCWSDHYQVLESSMPLPLMAFWRFWTKSYIHKLSLNSQVFHLQLVKILERLKFLHCQFSWSFGNKMAKSKLPKRCLGLPCLSLCSKQLYLRLSNQMGDKKMLNQETTLFMTFMLNDRVSGVN